MALLKCNLIKKTFFSVIFVFIVWYGFKIYSSYRFKMMNMYQVSLLKTMMFDRMMVRGLPSYFQLNCLYGSLMFEYLTSPDYTKDLRQRRLGNMVLNYYSSYDLMLLAHEIFTKKSYFFTAVKSKPYIVDCGSNIGLATLFFKKLYPEAKVLCFEPDSHAFKALQKNISDNNMSDIVVVNKALHKAEGTLKLSASPRAPGAAGMSLYDTYQKPAVSVVVDRLSKYITEPVDFLKMDIEGAEVAVIAELDAASKLSLIREMIIEYHHSMMSKEEGSLAELLGVLQKNNFEYILSAPEPIPFHKHRNQGMLIYAYHLD